MLTWHPVVRLFGRQKEKVEAGLQRTRRGLFARVAGLIDRSEAGDELWDDLEEALIGADVGVSLTAQLIDRVRDRSRSQGLRDGASIGGLLRQEMRGILRDEARSRSPLADTQAGDTLPSKPYIVLIVGVNGVGKTTSIAKLAHRLSQDGKKVILAAGDTFRAAAVEQLNVWGDRAGTDVIAHRHGADPGAVVYDALEAARARRADVLIIDTAGRLHTKANLMEELKKVHRVIGRFDHSAPHETILVLDAATGQNGVAQAKEFGNAVKVTGVLLAKLDGTAKGGVVLAVADQLKLPVLFLGTGEQIDDLAPFDADDFLEALFARGA